MFVFLAPHIHPFDGVFIQALDRSERVRDHIPRLGRIMSATRGIIFLGTPHRGSTKASLVQVVASVAQVTLQSVNNSLIRDLERDSPTLDRLRDSFCRILDRRVFTVWSFAEELAMAGGSKVYDLD
jgi:hypothetical protein